jgi:hypothetical protein
MAFPLTPTQRKVMEHLLAIWLCGNIFVLWTPTGLGKSTILDALRQRIGGKLLNMRDFIEAHRQQHPLALDETFYQLIMEALSQNEVVLVDDLHLVEALLCCYQYPREGLLTIALKAICTYAMEADEHIVFAHDGAPLRAVHARCFPWASTSSMRRTTASFAPSILGPKRPPISIARRFTASLRN